MAAGVESSTGKMAVRRLMCNFLLSGFGMTEETAKKIVDELNLSEDDLFILMLWIAKEMFGGSYHDDDGDRHSCYPDPSGSGNLIAR